jgi:hypothetical protein
MVQLLAYQEQDRAGAGTPCARQAGVRNNDLGFWGKAPQEGRVGGFLGNTLLEGRIVSAAPDRRNNLSNWRQTAFNTSAGMGLRSR